MSNYDRLVIIQAGGGAAGKSTTSKAFAIGEPRQFRELRDVETVKGIRPMMVNWTLYDNYALAGNHKSGTDSNTGPGAVRSAFFECMKHRDIVVVDGMVSSPKWALMCNEYADVHPDHALAVLLVHYDFPAEELLRRLANRRNTTPDAIYDSMWDKCVGLVRRAELLMEHFSNLCALPQFIIKVKAKHSTAAIVAMMDDKVCEIMGDCE